MPIPKSFSRIIFLFLIAILPAGAAAQTAGAKKVYDIINSFELTGGSVNVNNLVLKRDRATMTFTGTFHFTAPMQGYVTGAVFIGNGTFKAEVPPSEFEKDNVKRLLGTDVVESTFTRAVLRFTDDTFSVIGAGAQPGTATVEAQKLATDQIQRSLRESSTNYSGRLAQALLNGEPGVFIGTFEGGQRGRFTLVFDPMTHIPTKKFDINAGEKMLVYSFMQEIFGDEVWLAAYSEQDYKQGSVSYSSLFDLVDITAYKMTVDLTSPKEMMKLKTTITMKARMPEIMAIPFNLGENLGSYEDQNRKKQLKVKTVTMAGQPLTFAQEEREGGFTVFLNKRTKQDEEFSIDVELEGDYIRQPQTIDHAHYPRSNSSWYPRHGYLDRSTFDMKFIHTKKYKIAAVGTRTQEEALPEGKDLMVTNYVMKDPVALVTFAMAPWERHADTIKWDKGDAKPIPLEFSSMPGEYLAIKEDFIVAELSNTVRFFHALFGDYPYEKYGASFHPYGFGQGFATMLMIPNTDRASKYTYVFVAHETAHQWWGNIVAWRSYRDQWLSEGFAEYSGILYTAFRENPKAAMSLIEALRREIKEPPPTLTGVGKGKLNDIGPIILGHRLNPSKSFGAYQALIYNKGALVLRMLHFLFKNPVDGDDKAFYAMMKDFVTRYRNGEASTDDFRLVANEHFANTPVAKKYGLKDLNWFFNQWIYNTNLPSYKLEYQIEAGQGGGAVVTGNVIQEGAGEKWFMPIPVVFKFSGGRQAGGTVAAFGPKQPFKIPLPERPEKVEFDPDKWVLSDKTESK